MEDTNSQNINDVFRYEANNEGASTPAAMRIIQPRTFTLTTRLAF